MPVQSCKLNRNVFLCVLCGIAVLLFSVDTLRLIHPTHRVVFEDVLPIHINRLLIKYNTLYSDCNQYLIVCKRGYLRTSGIRRRTSKNRRRFEMWLVCKGKIRIKYAIQSFFTLMFSVILVSYRRNTVGMITFNLTFAHNAGRGVFGRRCLPYFKEFL